MTAEPVPIDRDYVSEMRAVIDAETKDAPYVSRAVAEHVVRKLRATDSELLWNWLDAQAEQFVWQAINDRDRSIRGRARATSSRSKFAENAERFSAGDSTAMDGWLAVPFAVEDGRRKRLADLTADDLRFVASSYDRRAAENAFEAAFFRALAEKVGADTVRDHFTDEQLTALRSSIAGLG